MPFIDRFTGLFRTADPESAPATEQVTLTDPLACWLFGAVPTYAGKSVTLVTAMTLPAVSSAVELIAEAVGTLPAKPFVRNAKGKEANLAHLAFRLVQDEANNWTSAAELGTQLTHDALLHDRSGFTLTVRGGSGNVIEFHRLDAVTVETKTDEATGEPFYLSGKGQKRKRHEYWDVLHVRGGSPKWDSNVL